MKILITGGAGYIGNELIKKLPKSAEIVVIDNFNIDTKHKRQINDELKKSHKLTLIEANTSEVSKYRKYMNNIDILVYMASLNSYKESNSDPFLYLTENNINLQKLLNVLKDQSPNLKKCILTSSRGVYGEGPYKCLDCKNRFNPLLSENLKCKYCQSKDIKPQLINENDEVNPSSYYGLSKKIQEDLLNQYCLQNKIQLDIFRIFNVYGKDQGRYYSNIGIIPQIFNQISKDNKMYLSGDGMVTRDFIDVGDVIKVLLESIRSKNKKRYLTEIYNLGSGNPVSIADVANYFSGIGYKFKKNKFKKFGDIKFSVANNSKILKQFNIGSFKNIYSFLDQEYNKND